MLNMSNGRVNVLLNLVGINLDNFFSNGIFISTQSQITLTARTPRQFQKNRLSSRRQSRLYSKNLQSLRRYRQQR